MKFYSDITKNLYDSIQECEAAEAAHLKAEEEKKNGHNAAIAELDVLWEAFQKQKKVQEDAYKDMVKMGGVISIIIGGVIILGVGIFYWTNYGPGGKADLDGIVVEINDKELVLPCTYDDIKELGFLAVDESDLTEISADREKSVKVKNSKNEYLTVVFINTDVDTKDATECKIYEIKAEYPVTVFDYSSIPDYTIDEITSGSYSYSSYINETQTDANRGPKISLYNGFSTNNSMESNQKAVGDSSFGMRGHTDISIKQGVNRGLLHASYGGNSGKELAYVSIKVYP